MEDNMQIWAWVLLGILQFMVLASFVQFKKLKHLCINAHHWAVANAPHTNGFDFPGFTEKLIQTEMSVRSLPYRYMIAGVINSVMLYFISAGNVPVFVQVLAAFANASLVVAVYNSNTIIFSINKFISMVETAKYTKTYHEHIKKIKKDFDEKIIGKTDEEIEIIIADMVSGKQEQNEE